MFAGPTLHVAKVELSATETLFLGLLVDGFHLAPRGMGALSTPTTEADVDALADAVVGRLEAMQQRRRFGQVSRPIPSATSTSR